MAIPHTNLPVTNTARDHRRLQALLGVLNTSGVRSREDLDLESPQIQSYTLQELSRAIKIVERLNRCGLSVQIGKWLGDREQIEVGGSRVEYFPLSEIRFKDLAFMTYQQDRTLIATNHIEALQICYRSGPRELVYHVQSLVTKEAFGYFVAKRDSRTGAVTNHRLEELDQGRYSSFRDPNGSIPGASMTEMLGWSKTSQIPPLQEPFHSRFRDTYI